MRTRPLPPLTLLRILFSYDPGTGHILRRVPMSKFPAGSIAGSPQHDYIYVEYRRCRMLAHRLGWALHYGAWPDGELDHVNSDKHDNRLANLRPASTTDNQRNRPLQRNNSTGFKGVTRHKTTGKYMAKISHDKRAIYLGVFESPDEAAHVYNKAAILLHGEFARLNPVGVDHAQ